MKLWLLITLTLFVQEPISTGAVLWSAYQLHYNFWIIHAIFAIATLIDIAAGYYLGKFVRRKLSQRNAIAKAEAKLEKFSAFLGRNGKIVTLIVYSPIIFPISGFFIPWFDISLTDALVFIFIGEVLFWYIPEWLLVFGIRTFVTDPFTALYIIVVVSTLITFAIKYFWDRARNPGKLHHADAIPDPKK